MGASSSLIINPELDIYLFYPNKTEFIEKLIHTLQKMSFILVDSSLMIQSKKEISISEIPKYMELFMEKTKFIFVCISSNTIKTVTQIIEMNEIMDKYPILEKKIIYLMMESNYTPITDDGIKDIVKQNLWYPIYDEDSLFYTTNKLLTGLCNQTE